TRPSQSTRLLANLSPRKRKTRKMKTDKSQLVKPSLNVLIIGTLNLTDSEISDIESDSDSGDVAHDHQSRFSDNLNHEEFYTEAEESLSRAFLENHSIENAMIELKTLRMT